MFINGQRVIYQGDLAEIVETHYRQTVRNGYLVTYAVYGLTVNGRTVEAMDSELLPVPDTCVCDLWRGCTCGVMLAERARGVP